MLEWYRAYAVLELVEEDLRWILTSLVPNMTFERTSIPEFFCTSFGFDLKPETSREELLALVRDLGLDHKAEDTWDELFLRIYIEKLEPSLPAEKGCFVYDFPPSHAALARLKSTGWADRFEFYWKGLEIANAFHELNDPEEQLKRHQKDQETRRSMGKVVPPVDWNFIRSLRQGMPPSGGIALGLDRLFMAVYDLNEIKDTRLFPLSHQLEANLESGPETAK
jgi:lysyl-tRNA synthetase class 2